MNRKEYVLGENKIFVEHLVPDEKKYSHPLLFIHGSFGGFFMWKMITSYLVNQGFECFALSLRGHKPSGDTDLSQVSMEDYVADIDLVINELELKDPVLIGHSMAGLLVLMHEKSFNKASAIVCIDPSPSLEIQGAGKDENIKKIPLVYNAMEAGMPTDPMEAMKALPDISKDMLMEMKEMLGNESGKARKDRKVGISIPKDSINKPLLFMSAELGKSVPFGVSPESTQKMSDYYGGELFEVKGATHPGIIMGTHTSEVIKKIENWLS